MDEEDFFKIIGFIVFGMFVIYYVVKCLHFQTSIFEGLENNPDTVAAPTGGVAGSAKDYLAQIKAITVKLDDVLLMDKYKADYEEIVIATDDLIDRLMVKALLSVKIDPARPEMIVQQLQAVTMLKNDKDALNSVMTFLNKQSGSAVASTGLF
jgi:hypothetical protein